MSEEAQSPSKRATDQSQRQRDATEAIRARTDTTAKALGAIGTAAVTAIGYAKLADVFPWHGPVWAVAVLGVGAFLMIVAVLGLVRGFQSVGESVISTSSAAETKELSGLSLTDLGRLPKRPRSLRRLLACVRIRRRRQDGEIIDQVYGQAAELNQVESLSAYEARGFRFERIAERSSNSGEAEALRTRAIVIYTEVLASQVRAALLVTRHRARRAIFSWSTAFWVMAFVVGWYGVAVSADRLQSNRGNAAIEKFKLCGEAQEKNPKSMPLPECDYGKAPPSPALTAKQKARAKYTGLVTSLAQCEERAETIEEDPTVVCASIKTTLQATLAGG